MPLYSLEFLIFLSIVFILYWTLFKNTAPAQNTLLTIASLFFYGWVDWKCLSLLIFSTLFNFYFGRLIHKNNHARTRWLLLCGGLTVNLGILVYFKYFHFFYTSFIGFFGLYDNATAHSTLQIILPLGISFFTFQAIGYLIDLYNEETEPCPRLLDFAVFMTYFPKITAGPIERAEDFIARINIKREFNDNQAVDGMRQILWGSFAKLVISNNCATLTNPIFDNYLHLPGSTLLLGAFLYTLQVYCDFSGYSNIAIGISKLLGIPLMRNFASPFFSTSIREYWRKWHISLSSWMMHYLFTPLSFSLRRYHKMGLIISVMTTFLLIGLWHGANWTYIVFGSLHGLYFIPSILAGTAGSASTTYSRKIQLLKRIAQMLGLFILVMLTLVFFGSNSVPAAVQYLSGLFSPSLFSPPVLPPPAGLAKVLATTLFILLLFTVEWLQKDKDHEMHITHITSPALRIGIYYAIILAILLFGSVIHIDFLYSQF